MIYLDYNATTPTDPRVVESMLPLFDEDFGNPSASTHRYGWQAKFRSGNARTTVARLIGAAPDDIIFTSGATEANNSVLHAVTCSAPNQHIVTSAIEHESVLEPLRYLEQRGVQVTRVPVASDGVIDIDDILAALRPNTTLISVMAANNEIGTLQPIAEIGEVAQAVGIPLHTDATQAVGKIPVNVDEWKVSYMTFSAHKMYGPKGVGAIYARDREALRRHPLILGGHQESGIRSGTLNTPGIVGFATACFICSEEMRDEEERISEMRRALWERLRASVSDISLNGHPERRLPGDLNILISGVDSVSLLRKTNSSLAMSTGSACTSEDQEPSHVLVGIGRSPSQARSSIRLSLGRFTRPEDVETVTEVIAEAVHQLRG